MTELSDEVKREIGQHFIFGFYGFDVSDSIKVLIKEYFVGNVIIMKRNVQSAAQLRRLIYDLQKTAKEAGMERPLMIGIDQENGLVSAFSSSEAGSQFPGALAQASTQSPDLVYRIAAATGKEMKMIGVNWAFSPVADVNVDPMNPVIGVRSFGDDPILVSRYVYEVARGLAEAGIAPCAKHFPGHGDTHIDSHYGLPVIRKSKEEMEKVELIPFENSINKGIASVMTAHIALPLVEDNLSDSPDSNGQRQKEKVLVPASLSHIITTSLLRESLNYKGVITTDCLEMAAVASLPGSVPLAAVNALKAGADIVMICHTFERQRDSVEAVYNAVRKGEIDVTEIYSSGRRIAYLKEVFAESWENVLSNEGILDKERWEEVKERNREFSREVYENSIAWLLPEVGSQFASLFRVVEGETSNEKKRVVVFSPASEKINPAVDSDDSFLPPANESVAPDNLSDIPRQSEESFLYVVTADGKRALRNTAGPAYVSFVKSLYAQLDGKRTIEHVVYSSESLLTQNIDVERNLKRLFDGADKENNVITDLIFILRSANLSRSSYQLSYLQNLISVLSQHKLKTIPQLVLLSTNTPYDLSDPSSHAIARRYPCLCTFEFTTQAMEAAVGVLCRRRPVDGEVPVRTGL